MSVRDTISFSRLLAHLNIKHKIIYDDPMRFSPKTFFPRGYDLFVLDGVLDRFKSRNIRRVLDNLYKSGVRYAMITNYPAERQRLEPIDGVARKVNLAHYGMRPLIMMSDGANGKTLTLYGVSNGRATTK